MNSRYFAKVVTIKDQYSIVFNKGISSDVKEGDKFLVVGLGELIVDPDTNEELEQLEIVRGKVEVIHPQEKISTAHSCTYEKGSDEKEIRRVSSSGGLGLASFLGSQDTVTETIKPGEKKLKKLQDAQVGDLLIKL